MNKPLVSIIMPAFNASSYLEDAINSVTKQTYTHWELIIVNDGSIDDTEEKVKAIEDSRIRYFSQSNQGVSAARNKALANMRGDFFCFLDADDVFPKESLEVRISAFREDPKLDFVDGQVLIVNNSLNKIIRIKTHSFIGNPFQALINLDERCFTGLTWMIKRKKNQIYQFREGLTHGEDLLFYIALSRNGGNYDAVNEPVLMYRQGHVSAMRNLKGLESGYIELYQVLERGFQLNEKQLLLLKNKLRTIMWKSYLADLSPWKAFQSYLRFIKL
ncbi:glycosyltransferase family 2 protein [Catalinimonas niigatensis]|uniref:glycosyltransferase family 2 protein n=1 Tax=Catalinimonas niigatensis TaxID=1397264 RepID=UPI00266603EA|nr:glycosyltransferase family 2 protein [Catalinimonas niigatensis]WPP52612.1 glycosyltransferase family 2 protein [Catalinimonas niigatensis]